LVNKIECVGPDWWKLANEIGFDQVEFKILRQALAGWKQVVTVNIVRPALFEKV
jgi:hypothetical protein